jgi:hypothetical protein
MKQRMKESHEKGLAICSASSLALLNVASTYYGVTPIKDSVHPGIFNLVLRASFEETFESKLHIISIAVQVFIAHRCPGVMLTGLFRSCLMKMAMLEFPVRPYDCPLMVIRPRMTTTYRDK